MTLRDILDGLVEYINDDTVEDALMRSAVRRAVKWAERNYTFKYMETFAVGTLQPPGGGNTPGLVQFGSNVKCILEDDGRVYRTSFPRQRWVFRQVSYDDFMSYDVGPPRSFFVVGIAGIVPTSIVSEEYKAEIPVAVYSAVDLADDEYTNWLFVNGEDFVVYKAATYVAAALRDGELRQSANLDADTALKTLLDADFDMRQGGRLERVGYADDELNELLSDIDDAGTPGGVGGSGSTWIDGSWWDDGSSWAD